MKKRLAVGLISFILLAGGANAAQIMQQFDFGPDTPNFSAGAFNADQFDPALGTLNFVELKLLINTEGGTLTVDNDGVDGGNLDGVSIGASGTISSSFPLLDSDFNAIGANVTAVTTGNFSLSGNVGDGAMDFDGSSPDGGILPGLNQTDQASGQLNPNFWSNVIGTGTFPITAEVEQVNDFGMGLGGVEEPLRRLLLPETSWSSTTTRRYRNHRR